MMIDWTFLRLTLHDWAAAQLPMTVAITLPQEMATDDVFNCLLNGRAVLGAGEAYRTSNNQTLEDIAAILADELEVADAEAVDTDEDDRFDTIILTRRLGYSLAITGATLLPADPPHSEPIAAEISYAQTPAIWANQNQPAPPEELWFSMMIYDLVKLGQDEISAPDDNGEAQRTGYRSFKLSLAAFGPGAYEAMGTLVDSLETPSVIDYFANLGLSCVGGGPVKEASEAVDKDIQERAALDLEFHMAVPYLRSAQIETTQVGVIETVDWTLEL